MQFRGQIMDSLYGIFTRVKDGFIKSFAYPYRKITFSQEGEDLILQELLGTVTDGRFIDVGAYHPIKNSNTFLFYSMGWRGINIDANPNSMQLFRKYRPDDVNLELVISSARREISYYRFEKRDLNTIDPEEAERKVVRGFKLADVIPLESVTMIDAMAGQSTDNIVFMSIDVEGHELEILKGVDWSKLSPRYLLIEILHQRRMDQLLKHPVVLFLKERNYQVVARTSRTVFFEKDLLTSE